MKVNKLKWKFLKLMDKNDNSSNFYDVNCIFAKLIWGISFSYCCTRDFRRYAWTSFNLKR